MKSKSTYTYVSPVICTSSPSPNGFLRSGNVPADQDSVGDAAALDVDAFLNLKMKDDRTLLVHIKEETYISKALLNICSETYETLRDGFLAVTNAALVNSTSTKIKQVYFPVGGNYHLLSLLSNSGIMFELKKRIGYIRLL